LTVIALRVKKPLLKQADLYLVFLEERDQIFNQSHDGRAKRHAGQLARHRFDNRGPQSDLGAGLGFMPEQQPQRADAGQFGAEEFVAADGEVGGGDVNGTAAAAQRELSQGVGGDLGLIVEDEWEHGTVLFHVYYELKCISTHFLWHIITPLIRGLLRNRLEPLHSRQLGDLDRLTSA